MSTRPDVCGRVVNFAANRCASRSLSSYQQDATVGERGCAVKSTRRDQRATECIRYFAGSHRERKGGEDRVCCGRSSCPRAETGEDQQRHDLASEWRGKARKYEGPGERMVFHGTKESSRRVATGRHRNRAQKNCCGTLVYW